MSLHLALLKWAGGTLKPEAAHLNFTSLQLLSLWGLELMEHMGRAQWATEDTSETPWGPVPLSGSCPSPEGKIRMRR